MKINERGYWENDTAEGHGFDAPLCQAIIKFLQSEAGGDWLDIADFGCGTGDYVQRIIAAGSNHCYAFDGNPNTPALTGGIGEVLDLSQYFRHGRMSHFDFVMSLEVGEHIPHQYEQTFLDNLTNHASRGIILSWAIPGQGGDGHVNEQPNDYIIAQMAKRGWQYDLKSTLHLRLAATFLWFKNTIMVFRRAHG